MGSAGVVRGDGQSLRWRIARVRVWYGLSEDKIRVEDAQRARWCRDGRAGEPKPAKENIRFMTAAQVATTASRRRSFAANDVLKLAAGASKEALPDILEGREPVARRAF